MGRDSPSRRDARWDFYSLYRVDVEGENVVWCLLNLEALRISSILLLLLLLLLLRSVVHTPLFLTRISLLSSILQDRSITLPYRIRTRWIKFVSVIILVLELFIVASYSTLLYLTFFSLERNFYCETSDEVMRCCQLIRWERRLRVSRVVVDERMRPGREGNTKFNFAR